MVRATPAQLESRATRIRFGLAINGESVDLAPYRVVRLPLRDGRHCGWLGVAAASVRASRNRFVYEVSARRTIDRRDDGGLQGSLSQIACQP